MKHEEVDELIDLWGKRKEHFNPSTGSMRTCMVPTSVAKRITELLTSISERS